MAIVVEFDGYEQLLKQISFIPFGDFLKEIMNMAREEVKTAYSQQFTIGSGRDFHTQVRKTKNAATLTVYGEDVGFLEFGAGAGTSPDVFAEEVGYDVHRGSYSEVVHGMYEKTGYSYWIWNRTEYTEIPATHGMEQALIFLNNHIGEFIREKINDWLSKGNA